MPLANAETALFCESFKQYDMNDGVSLVYLVKS